MRRLWDAPPVGDGPPPPERVVGWIGLLRALDAEIQRVLFPAVTRPPVRGAARALPREATRKAPLRRAWIEGLAGDIGSEAAGRADALGDRVAAGRLAARDVGLLDAAALLAVFGRGWTYAGARGDRVLGLGDLTDAEVLETARALSEAAAPRRELEAGRPVDGGALAGMERATFAVLGLLGRV